MEPDEGRPLPLERENPDATCVGLTDDEDGRSVSELDEGRRLPLDTSELDTAWLELFNDEGTRTVLEMDEGRAPLLGTREVDTARLELTWIVLDGLLLVMGAKVRIELGEGFAEELVRALLVDDGAIVIVCVV